MKVLITGAGGLLGRCMVSSFSKRHTVVAARHNALTPTDLTLDITNETAVLDFVSAQSPDWIINCAAHRSPDYCVANPHEAYRLNTTAVEFLARAATRTGAGLCHISSDYVFAGNKPPYCEDDPPLPFIIYGRTKLGGEFAARSTAKHLVVRIAALYRLDRHDPANVLTMLATALTEQRELQMDAQTVRYYTLADEVAEAVLFLLEHETQGIIHLSSQTATTRAAFARGIAKAIGTEPTLVKEMTPAPGVSDRPLNTHLATGRYESLGGPAFTGVDIALARLRALA